MRRSGGDVKATRPIGEIICHRPENIAHLRNLSLQRFAH